MMSGPRPLLEKEDLEQLAAWGYTVEQMAERLNCSKVTVVKWRKRYGITAPAPHKATRRSSEWLAHIESLIDDGWSFAEIARTEGTTRALLRRRFPGRAWSRSEVGEYAHAVYKHQGTLRKTPDRLSKAREAA